MLGIIVILTISWLLLHFIAKKNLGVLGFLPIPKSIGHFAIGFLFYAILKLLIIAYETQVKSMVWAPNPSIDFTLVFQSLYYHFISALTEDLVFRGALLYLLVRWLGTQKALLLSALIFGMYHWFSYGMLNSRLVPMVYILIVTGFAGYVWGYTYIKTNSIMMSLGFHMASNFVMTLFLPGQPFGELLYHQVAITSLPEWPNFFNALLVGLLPTVFNLLFVQYAVLKKQKSGVLGT